MFQPAAQVQFITPEGHTAHNTVIKRRRHPVLPSPVLHHIITIEMWSAIDVLGDLRISSASGDGLI